MPNKQNPDDAQNKHHQNPIEALKFEALSAIIIQGQQAAEHRHNDLKEDMRLRFDKVDERLHDNEEYNQIQNGRQADALNKIHALEAESQERKLTCMAAVQVLQKRTKYTRIVKWIDEHPKRAVVLIGGSVVLTQIIVLHAFQNNWLNQLWIIIKEIL